MANLLSWAGNTAKRIGNTLNNDVVKPINRDVVQPVQRVQQAVQTARPVVQRAETSANNMAVGFAKGVASGLAGVAQAPAANLYARLQPKNVYAQMEAKRINTQAQGLTAPILRTVPEAITTVAHPFKQFTYHPNSNIEKTLFGATPVQNIQKKVANNYDTHKRLSFPARVGLAGLEAVGSVAQDAPVVGTAGKIAKAGDAAMASRGIKVPIGLSTKNVGPDLKALAPLDKPAQDMFGKPAAKLTPNQLSQVMSQHEVKLPAGRQVTQKIGNARNGYSYENRTPALHYGTPDRSLMTDGYSLISNKTVAKKLINDHIDSEAKKLAMKVNDGTPLADRLKIARAGIENEAKQVSANHPDMKKFDESQANVLTKPYGNKAEVTGYHTNQSQPKAVISDGKIKVEVDANRLAFMEKHLPGSTLHINPDNPLGPVQYVRGGKIQGVLMPLKNAQEDIPDFTPAKEIQRQIDKQKGFQAAREKAGLPDTAAQAAAKIKDLEKQKAEEAAKADMAKSVNPDGTLKAAAPAKLPKAKTPFDTPAIIKMRQLQDKIPSTHTDMSPERIALREKVGQILYQQGGHADSGKAVPIKSNRRADIVLGPPASGKTNIVNPLIKEHGSRLIDNDEAKALLGDVNSAGALHQESDAIATDQLIRAAKRGDNIVLPLVGKNADRVKAAIGALKEHGYDINVHYNHLDPELTAQRAVTRFEETGRFVDPHYVYNEVGLKPKATYDILKNHEHVSTYTAYDNNVPFGEKPKLIEEGTNSRVRSQPDAAGRPLRESDGQKTPSPSEKSLSTPGTKKPKPPVEKAGIGAKPGGKPSRFSNVTVQRSDEVPTAVKKAAKAEKATYDPHTDAARGAAADKWLAGKDTNTAYSEVIKAFEANPTDQDAFNAIALAKKLSSTGNEADTALAGKIYALQSPKGSTAGQFIQAFAQLNRRTPEGLHNAAIKTLKKAKVDVTPEIEKEINTRMTKIRATKEGSDERQIASQDLVDYTNQQIPRTKMQAGIDFWRAGLLTGPETVAKIATSHLITSPMELIDRPLAAMTDKAVSAAPKPVLRYLNRNNSKATPGQRTVTFSPKDLKAFGKGMGYGGKAAMEHLTSGVDRPRTGGFAKDFGKSTHQSLYERTVYRVHGSVYKPFYAGAHEMERANLQRIAEKQFGGDAKKIQEFMDSPDAAQQMTDYAAQFAMQNETEPGKFTQSIQHFKPGGVPVGQWIAPFSRIPAALGVKGIVDYTPVGTVRAARQLVRGVTKGDFNQRKFSESLSKSAIGGTGLVTAGYLLMHSGRMTLQAPTDPKEKALWAAQGKTKNSIRIGGKWVTLNAFGPVGLALGLGGAFQRAHSAGESGSKATEQALASATKLLADQPYMKGLGGLTDALNNPVQKASGYVHSAVTSWIPAGVQQIARGTDQVARQYPDTLKQSIEQAIPWVREHTSGAATNPDMWGKNQPGTGRSGVVGGALGTVNPFYPSAERNQNDGPTQELQRLYNTLQSQDTPPFANPTSVTLFGNKIKLNNAQAQAMLQGTGPLIHDGIDQLMNNPTYSSLNDLQKSKAITSVIDKVRQDWVSGNADSVFNASQLKDMTAKGKGATLSSDQKKALGIASATTKKTSTKSTKSSSTTVKTKKVKAAKVAKVKTPRIAGTSSPRKLSATTKLPKISGYKPISYKTPKFTVKAPKSPSFKVAKVKRPKYPSYAIKTPKLTRKSIA